MGPSEENAPPLHGIKKCLVAPYSKRYAFEGLDRLSVDSPYSIVFNVETLKILLFTVMV